MDELKEFAKALVSLGIQAIAEEGRIRVDNNHYWLEDGKVTCDRGMCLNLAAPHSIGILVKTMLHCYQMGQCEDCLLWDKEANLHPTPDGISNELYDHIGWACGQAGKNCNTLCGRYAFYHCPLK